MDDKVYRRAYAGRFPQAQRIHVPREDSRRLRRSPLYLRRVRGARQPPRLTPARLGAKKGDRVAFLCPNTPPHLEATFAVPAAGLVLVAINTRLGKDEVTYIVEHSGAKMVFVDAELEKLLADVDVERVRIDDTGEDGDPYEDYLRRALPNRSRACWRMKRRPSP